MSERREYQIGDVKTTTSPRGPGGRGPGGRGPGGMAMGGEKPTDFKAAIGKLITYCKRYLPAIAIAIALAGAGTVLNIRPEGVVCVK